MCDLWARTRGMAALCMDGNAESHDAAVKGFFTSGRKVMENVACQLCELVQDLASDGRLHAVGSYWTANARQSPDRPAIVLQVREHRNGIESLDPAEASELGHVLVATARSLEAEPGVERVYVQSFNETPGGHVHFHVVPRFRGERTLGPMAETAMPAPNGFQLSRALGHLSDTQRRREVDAIFTGRVRGALKHWSEGRVHPYTWLTQGSDDRRVLRWLRRHADMGEFYVGVSLLLEVALLGLVAWFGGPLREVTALSLGFAALLLLRAFDIAIYHMHMLLNDEPRQLKGYARSLFLALLNLVELGVIAVGIAWVAGLSWKEAMLRGVHMSTLQPELLGGGLWMAAALTGLTVTAYIVAAGSIGLVVSKLSEAVHR